MFAALAVGLAVAGVQVVATASDGAPAPTVAATTVAAAPAEVRPVVYTQKARPAAPRVARKAVARKPPPAPELCVGAAAMTRDDCPPSVRAYPSGKAAWEDFGPAYDQGCVTLMPWEATKYRRCVYFGGKKTKNRPSIAIVGNSHAIHYLPPILALAQKNHWRVTTYLANKCFPTTVPLELSKRLRENCLAWGKWVMADTKAGGYDLVITSNRQGAAPLGVDRDKSYPLWRKGYSHYVNDWLDAGTRVLVIRDNPYPGNTHTTVPDCVARHQHDLAACSAPRDAWLRPDPLADAAMAADSPRAQVADLTRMFCTSVCPSVIGNVLVYRDESHLTATYSRTLAPYLAPYVHRALTGD